MQHSSQEDLARVAAELQTTQYQDEIVRLKSQLDMAWSQVAAMQADARIHEQYRAVSENEKIVLRAERDRLAAYKRTMDAEYNSLKEDRAKHLAQIQVFQAELDRMCKRFRAAEEAVKVRDVRIGLTEAILLKMFEDRKQFLTSLRDGFRYLNQLLSNATDEERQRFLAAAPPNFFAMRSLNEQPRAAAAAPASTAVLDASMRELADVAALSRELQTPQKAAADAADPATPPKQSPWSAQATNLIALLRAGTPGMESAAAIMSSLDQPVRKPEKKDVACGPDDSAPPFMSPVRLSGAKFEERLIRAVESFHKEDAVADAADADVGSVSSQPAEPPSQTPADADFDAANTSVVVVESDAMNTSAVSSNPPGSESPSRRKRPELPVSLLRTCTADIDLRSFDPADADADHAKWTSRVASMAALRMCSLRLLTPALDVSGEYSTVYLAMRDGESSPVVVKQCKPRHLLPYGRKMFQNEADMLQLLAPTPGADSQVVELLEHFDADGVPHLVLERAEGNLSQLRLQSFPPPFRSKLFRKICGECMRLLKQLRDNGVIHGDLRPENVLWKPFALHKTIIKACDFGHSLGLGSPRHTAYLEEMRKREPIDLQTIGYRAPELLLGLPFDTQVDTWSIGLTLLELYVGARILDASSPEAYLRSMIEQFGPVPRDMVRRGMFTGNFPGILTDQRSEQAIKTEPRLRHLDEIRREDPVLADFFSGLLTYEPSKRFTPTRALDHEYCIVPARESVFPTPASVGASPTPAMPAAVGESPRVPRSRRGSVTGSGGKRRRVTPVSVHESTESPFRSNDTPDSTLHELRELKDHIISLLETYGVVSLPYVVGSYSEKHPDVPVSDFEVLQVLEGGCLRIRDVYAAREVEDTPAVLRARPVMLDFLASLRSPFFYRADVEKAFAAARVELTPDSRKKLMNELCKVVSPGSKTWRLKSGDGTEPIIRPVNSPKTLGGGSSRRERST